MGSSKFDKKIAFQKKQGDRWENQFQRWSNILYLRGAEAVVAGRLAGRNTAVITVRVSRETLSVDTSWRIKRGNDVFKIQSIIPGEDREFIDFTCETGSPT